MAFEIKIIDNIPHGRRFLICVWKDKMRMSLEHIFHRYGFLEKMIYVYHDSEESHFHVYCVCDEYLSIDEIRSYFLLEQAIISFARVSEDSFIDCVARQFYENPEISPDSSIHVLSRRIMSHD
jgi:hypothetical protein